MIATRNGHTLFSTSTNKTKVDTRAHTLTQYEHSVVQHFSVLCMSKCCFSTVLKNNRDTSTKEIHFWRVCLLFMKGQRTLILAVGHTDDITMCVHIRV